MIKPILFNTPMVQAILAGRKTVTRRVVKPQPKAPYLSYMRIVDNGTIKALQNGPDYPDGPNDEVISKYQVGDILWVRETWAHPLKSTIRPDLDVFVYKANGEHGLCSWDKWRPSIHMPKEAARIFLRVTDVRVERLQEITEEDVAREGTRDCDDYIVPKGPDIAPWHIACFEQLWNSTLKEKQTGLLSPYRFRFNPWVWVYSIERCEKPEGFI